MFKKRSYVVFIFITILVFPSFSWSHAIKTNILNRVFFIKYGDSYGTGFTIEVDDRQYLITAKHVLPGIKSDDSIEIFHDNKWKSLGVKTLVDNESDHDIIVLIPSFQLSPTFILIPDSGNVVLGQDIYFLGFPYGLKQDSGNLNRGFPLPFVKKGIIAGLPYKGYESLWFIDGHINPVMSGGPIIFEEIPTKKLKVLAVNLGYWNHPSPVFRGGVKTDENVLENSGIFIGCDIKEAVKLIKERPEGPVVK